MTGSTSIGRAIAVHESVVELADEKGLGTLCIEAFAKGPWPDDVPEDERPYEPYDSEAELGASLRFALSHDVTSITNAGDPELVSAILGAAESFEPMDETERAELLERARDADSPVPAP